MLYIQHDENTTSNVEAHQVALCVKLNIPYRIVRFHTNEHWEMHNFRTIATISCIKLLRNLRRDANIIDVFSSHRVDADYCDANVFQHHTSHDLTYDEQFCSMQGHCLYVDCYDVAESLVYEQVKKYGLPAGLVFLSHGPLGGSNGYGAMKITNGTMEYYCGQTRYSNNKDWYYEAALGSVCFKQTIGPFCVALYFARRGVVSVNEAPIMSQIQQRSLSWNVLSHTPISFLRFLVWQKNRTLRVWAPALGTSVSALTRGTRFGLQNYEAAIRNACHNDPAFSLYKKFFPDDAATIIVDTTLYIAYHSSKTIMEKGVSLIPTINLNHERIDRLIDHKPGYVIYLLLAILLLTIVVLGVIFAPEILLLILLILGIGYILKLSFFVERPGLPDLKLLEDAINDGPCAFSAWHKVLIDHNCYIPLSYNHFIKGAVYNLTESYFPEGDNQVNLPFSDKMIRQGTYAIFVPFILYPRPVRHWTNLKAALAFRIFKKPKHTFDPLMLEVLTFPSENFDPIPFDFEHVCVPYQNEQSTAMKRRRFHRVVKHITSGLPLGRSVECHGKSDETVPWKQVGDKYAVVQRLIMDVPAETNHVLQGLAKSISRILADHIDEPWTFTDQFKARWYYVSSFNAQALCDELQSAIIQLQNDIIHVAFIVLGDDAVALRMIDGELCAFESDFSMYDQTQGIELQRILYNLLVHLGVSEDYLEPWIQLIQSRTLKVKHIPDEVKVKFERRVMQLTGISTTSVFNSLLNLYISTMCHKFCFAEPNTLEDVYGRFGLTIKLKQVQPLLHGIEFLKGFFVFDVVSASWKWGPSPVMIFKMGKVLNNPNTIFQTRDREYACKSTAWALSQSLGQVPACYPILGAFLKQLSDFGIVNDKKDLNESSQYKILVGVDQFLAHARESFLQVFCYRFNLTESMIKSLEHTILKSKLPCVFYHPAIKYLIAAEAEW